MNTLLFKHYAGVLFYPICSVLNHTWRGFICMRSQTTELDRLWDVHEPQKRKRSACQCSTQPEI